MYLVGVEIRVLLLCSSDMVSDPMYWKAFIINNPSYVIDSLWVTSCVGLMLRSVSYFYMTKRLLNILYVTDCETYASM